MEKSVIKTARIASQVVTRPVAADEIVNRLPLSVIKNVKCLRAELNGGILGRFEVIFHGISKAVTGCAMVALWLGLAGALLYGLVRFVHWAWYQ